MTPSPLPATPPMHHIALADDHALVRMGYRRLLELEPDLRVVAEYADAASAHADLTRRQQSVSRLLGRPGAPAAAETAPPELQDVAVDLLILDLSMPGRSGLDLLRQLGQALPQLKVLVVSMHDSPAQVTQCLRAGACGFVSKSGDPDDVVQAVRRALDGSAVPMPSGAPTTAPQDHRNAPPHMQLTSRETEVLQRLLAGLGIDGIASQLGLSEKTVSNYQTLIRQKLGVGSAIELVHYARQHGLLP